MRVAAVLLAAGLGLCPGPLPAQPRAATGPAAPFAGGIPGPEGLAFTNDGHLVVGTTTGEIRRYAPDGTFTVLAKVGDSLAGVTVLRDGRVLAAALGALRIWSVNPSTGAPSVFASPVAGPNVIVQTHRGRVLASASVDGTIVDVTNGTPVVRASGLGFPNDLALGGDRFLYVAETARNQVSRLRMRSDGSLGAPEVYATGLPLADGLAFDRGRNLLVAGGGAVRIVVARTRAVLTVRADPLLDWPSNLAFGRPRGFGRRDVFLANFGPGFGDGTTVVRLPFNHAGARLIR